jgi:hypothetical protein
LGELLDKAKLNVAIQSVWNKTFGELENARPKNTNPSIYVAALEKLAKLADYGVSHGSNNNSVHPYPHVHV